MKKEKISLLNNIINSVKLPIIIEDVYTSLFKDTIMIEATNGIEDFTDNPLWLKDIKNKKCLIIRNIDYLHKDEQLKLIEILKYKKIGVNKLDNLFIILTVSKMDLNNIHDEIISLTVQV